IGDRLRWCQYDADRNDATIRHVDALGDDVGRVILQQVLVLFPLRDENENARPRDVRHEAVRQGALGPWRLLPGRVPPILVPIIAPDEVSPDGRRDDILLVDEVGMEHVPCFDQIPDRQVTKVVWRRSRHRARSFAISIDLCSMKCAPATNYQSLVYSE